MKNNADGIEMETFSLIAVHFALFEGKYQHAHVHNHDASEGYKVIFPYHQRCSLLNTSADKKCGGCGIHAFQKEFEISINLTALLRSDESFCLSPF